MNLFYILDSKNNLIDFSSNWDTVATSSGAPELNKSEILGMPLHKFIDGDSTKMYIESGLQFARLKKECVTKFYRCDTPEFKRDMKMVLTPLDKGMIKLEHSLVSKTPWRSKVNFFTLNDRKSFSLLRCSICNNVNFENSWVQQDDLYSLLPDCKSNNIVVSYTVCPKCLKS